MNRINGYFGVGESAAKTLKWLYVLGAITFLVLYSGSFTSFKSVDSQTPFQFSKLKFFPKMPLPDYVVTIEGAELGRHLFYDPILSKDSTFSCATCHKPEAAFSDTQAFTKGVNGDLSSRNVMPLFNLAWYPSMFWDGRSMTIEDQALQPVRSHLEMDLDWNTAEARVAKRPLYKIMFKKAFGESKIDSNLIANALGQFERTLISGNSKYDQVLRGERYFTEEEYEGFNLVNDQTKGNCLHCHTSDGDALGTTAEFSNNGLDAAMASVDYKDRGLGGVSGMDNFAGWFKIPSLRNLVFTAPYMHDGRFETLEAVMDFYSEGVNQSYNIDSKMGANHRTGAILTSEEKRKIILFLKTMSDSSFVNNEAFSNPFL